MPKIFNRLMSLDAIYSTSSKEYPDKLALKEGKNEITFSQLENSANALANKLSALGVLPGDKLVVLSEKIIELPIIASAIWKVGAVYVPLDSELPVSRLNQLMDDLSPVLVFCSAKKMDNVMGEMKVPSIVFETIIDIEIQKEVKLFHPVVQDNTAIAYIIFTSGSTGKPKGVMISHKSLLDYFVNQNEIFGFTPHSFGFSISPFHFDVSIEDTFLPLSRGSSVYLYKGIPVASRILKILEIEKISHVIMVSTILYLFTKLKDKIVTANLENLKLIMTGAEVCNVDVINFWKSTFPQIKIYNAYGPTETTIVSHCYEIKNVNSDMLNSYPIGKPLSNVFSILIDEKNNQITEVNKKGELLIGGSQVMLGYLDEPAETEKVMFHFNGMNYYRTGDYCFIDKNNDYNFLGRSDSEIKLNGRRINLTEIETQLLLMPEVDKVVIGVISQELEKNLIVTLNVNKTVSKERLSEINEHLKSTLPKYMVPSHYGIVGKTLMSSTGKFNGKKINQLLEKSINSCTQFQKYFELVNDNFVGV